MYKVTVDIFLVDDGELGISTGESGTELECQEVASHVAEALQGELNGGSICAIFDGWESWTIVPAHRILEIQVAVVKAA